MSFGVTKATAQQGQVNTFAALANVANGAGAGEGDTVTVAVTFEDQYGNGLLPSNYAVSVLPSQAAFTSVSDKTTSGFNVVLSPAAPGDTLAAGCFDVIVFG